MNRLNPEQLEKMVHAALRSLPDRRAPASLEARVLAAVQARAAPISSPASTPWDGWHITRSPSASVSHCAIRVA